MSKQLPQTQPKVDADFARLLERDAVLNDIDVKELPRPIRRHLDLSEKIPDEEFDIIKDEGTRRLMKKWNSYF